MLAVGLAVQSQHHALWLSESMHNQVTVCLNPTGHIIFQ
jgi:hypothetical protein